MQRVVVTGIGVVSAMGVGLRPFWEAVRAGRPGFRPLRGDDLQQLRFKLGGQSMEFDGPALLGAKAADPLDRYAQMALVAAKEAVEQSGIEWTDALREDGVVMTGSCVGGQESQDREFYQLYGKNNSRVHPLSIVRIMANGGASAISSLFGLRGRVENISTACSSSNHAIGRAFELIHSGAAEVAIAGGAEAPFNLGFLKAWEAMRVVSTDTCRPFSLNRSGLLLGEGAAMMVLESGEMAERRGAVILGEITGFGESSDAGHITQPDPEGAAAAMRRALKSAGWNAQEVEYINAHGTGTTANDVVETAAIKKVLGDQASRVMVSSTKSMLGHSLGAAGAMEAAATLMGLREGVLPPTANFTERDPQCDLDVIPNVAREVKVDKALSNSFAFGGLNAVLALRRGQ